MNQPVTGHILAPLVSPLADTAELEEPAKGLIKPSYGPREYLMALDAAEMWVDALKFLAHLLPRREAVWWAWMSAKRQAGPAPKPTVVAALDAAERWITQPTEENRQAALTASEPVLDTGAGCAALAAFLTGNLAPPGVPEVPPPPFGTARAVIGSLLLSAVTTEPELAPEKYKKYLADGLQLADRIRLWDALLRGPTTPTS